MGKLVFIFLLLSSVYGNDKASLVFVVREHEVIKEDMYKIVEEEISQEKTKILLEGLDEDAKEKKGLPSTDSCGFYIKDGDKILGGIQGNIVFGALYIHLLWVTKELRNQGYGTKLVESIEKIAKEKNCKMINLETYDFQALDFYKKMGFKVDFIREGFFKDLTCYYLRKTI